MVDLADLAVPLMGIDVIQTSFAKGEFAPGLLARVDLAAYKVGAALLENFFVHPTGGASNRPGTAWVGPSRQVVSGGGSGPPRLIPFTFSTVQTYVLEFGNFYFRVITSGGYVLESNKTITNVTSANPGVVTSNAHGYSNGDWVYITGVVGDTRVNNRFFSIAGVTANTFQLLEPTAHSLDMSGYPAYVSGGIARRVYTPTSPYAVADLPQLKFVQSADTMTITHPDYAPRDLTRSSSTSWAFTTITFAAATAAPTGVTAVASIGGSVTTYSYVVTAISADGKEESLASAAGSVATAKAMSITAAEFISVSWTGVSGASRYNVYRQAEVPGGAPAAGDLYGYVGGASANSFSDHNISPDFTRVPPQGQNPFASSNNPSVATYFQQRKTYAGSTANPDTIWESQPGNFKNFNDSTPTRDSDAITATLNSLQVNAIQWLVPMGSGMLALTTSGAWLISSGSQGTPLTPASFNAQPQAYNGCSMRVPPIVVLNDVLYIQARGAIVRDLSYNFYVNIYTGTDMTILSGHLFFGHTILEWAYAEEPFKMIWAVRDDGVLLGFTYLKEQEVFAWTHHLTQGLFISVAAVSEGQEDAVYVVVRRTIPNVNGGGDVYYIERMHTRSMIRSWRNFESDVCAAWFVDCAVQSARTTPAVDCTISGLTNIGTAETPSYTGTATLTASAAVFTSGDVGNIVRINSGVLIVTAFTSTTVVTASVQTPPISQARALSGNWLYTPTFTTLTGLDHLEGATVSALSNGAVIPDQVVTGGKITLSIATDICTAGLSYEAKLQSLYVDPPVQAGTAQGRRKDIPSVTVRVEDTRGLQVGPDFDHLNAMKERGQQMYGQPTPLTTGDQFVNTPNVWDTPGQVCILQTYPLPCTILGLIPDVLGGDNA